MAERCHCTDLGERFDDQDAGHNGPAGEVAAEEPLVGAHVLDANGSLPFLDLDHAINEEEGEAVRDDRLNGLIIEAAAAV